MLEQFRNFESALMPEPTEARIARRKTDHQGWYRRDGWNWNRFVVAP